MASELGMQPKPELLVARTLHRSGALAEAEAMYRQVLLTDPNDEQSHHLLGVIAHQGGRNEEAARLMRRAVELEPGLATFRYHLARVLGAILLTGYLGGAVASHLRAGGGLALPRARMRQSRQTEA